MKTNYELEQSAGNAFAWLAVLLLAILIAAGLAGTGATLSKWTTAIPAKQARGQR